MRRQLAIVLAGGVVVGFTLAAPAVARTTGKESFRGIIVASGDSGTRTAVSTVIIASGVFDGVGRVVEVQNRPGDPDNVSRDDLVFPQGRIHILSTNGASSPSLNSQTCVFTGRVEQTTKVQGGTGRFRHASGSFAGAVRTRLVAARAADGSCSQEQAPLLEVDAVSGRGHMTF
jgi:hypothetical protein